MKLSVNDSLGRGLDKQSMTTGRWSEVTATTVAAVNRAVPLTARKHSRRAFLRRMQKAVRAAVPAELLLWDGIVGTGKNAKYTCFAMISTTKPRPGFTVTISTWRSRTFDLERSGELPILLTEHFIARVFQRTNSTSLADPRCRALMWQLVDWLLSLMAESPVAATGLDMRTTSGDLALFDIARFQQTGQLFYIGKTFIGRDYLRPGRTKLQPGTCGWYVAAE